MTCSQSKMFAGEAAGTLGFTMSGLEPVAPERIDVLVLKAMAAWDPRRGRLTKQFAAGATGLIFLQCLQDVLYHWRPWKVFTTRLVASLVEADPVSWTVPL